MINLKLCGGGGGGGGGLGGKTWCIMGDVKVANTVYSG